MAQKKISNDSIRTHTVWWTKVEKGLPLEWKEHVSKWVLVHHDKNRPFVAHYRYPYHEVTISAGWWDTESLPVYVTAWMPLPRP